MPTHPNPAMPAERPRPWLRFVQAPFTADTWRRSAYALFALPVGIAALPLALLGGTATAGGLQRGLARRFLSLTVTEAAPTTGKTIGHTLLALPLNAVSCAVSGYLWLLVIVNLAYPLRPDVTSSDLKESWGGPTLAGAWAVHGGIALLLLFLMPWIVRALTWPQAKLLRALLGIA